MFFCTTSPSAVGSTTHDDTTMLELTSAALLKQEQQESTEAMETQKSCYSPTPMT